MVSDEQGVCSGGEHETNGAGRQLMEGRVVVGLQER